MWWCGFRPGTRSRAPGCEWPVAGRRRRGPRRSGCARPGHFCWRSRPGRSRRVGTLWVSGAWWRLSATMHLKPITFLPDGSYLAEIVSRSVRGGRTRIALANVDGDLQLATHIPVRVIEYRGENHTTTSETFRLITTIVD